MDDQMMEGMEEKKEEGMMPEAEVAEGEEMPMGEEKKEEEGEEAAM
jgi:uncharacterized protein YabE (DUF348 family)